MHEYFQVNNEDQPTESESMNNEAMNNEQPTMNNEQPAMNNEAMNNEAMNNEAMNNEAMNTRVTMDPEVMGNSVMTDEGLSCQAALQTAMDKCVSEPVTSESPEETMSSGEPVIEGFKNPTQLWQPNVKLLLNVLIMMCVFYLLSHFETGKYLSSVVKGLKGRNLHLLLTLLFGLVYLILNKYL